MKGRPTRLALDLLFRSRTARNLLRPPPGGWPGGPASRPRVDGTSSAWMGGGGCPAALTIRRTAGAGHQARAFPWAVFGVAELRGATRALDPWPGGEFPPRGRGGPCYPVLPAP